MVILLTPANQTCSFWSSLLIKLRPLLLHLFFLCIHQQLEMPRALGQTALGFGGHARGELLHRVALFCDRGFFGLDDARAEF